MVDPILNKPSIPPAVPPSPPPATNANTHEPEERRHYEGLIAFFDKLLKWTLLALGIIITAALILLWRDTSAIKQTAADAIRVTQEAATLKIDRIRDEAREVALSEARKRVAEAFQSENVRSMVEQEARRRAGPEIDRQVRLEVDRAFESIQVEIASMGELFDLAMKMRIGLRPGLIGLLRLTKEGKDPTFRSRADSLLRSISSDYEFVTRENVKRSGGGSISFAGVEVVKDKGLNIPSLVSVIRTDPSLMEVAAAFLALEEDTGKRFRMFDLEGVEQWCRELPARCQ